jgi:hypothetical protein
MHYNYIIAENQIKTPKSELFEQTGSKNKLIPGTGFRPCPEFLLPIIYVPSNHSDTQVLMFLMVSENFFLLQVQNLYIGTNFYILLYIANKLS